MPNQRILFVVVKDISNFKRLEISLGQDVPLPIESASIGHKTTRHRSTVVDRHIRTCPVGDESVVPCDRACGTRGTLRFNLFPFWVYAKQFTDVYANTDVIEAGCFMRAGEIPHTSVRKCGNRPAQPRTRRHPVNQRTSTGHPGAMQSDSREAV